MGVKWQALVFSPEGMKHLDKLASRRFNESVISEEAVTYVIEKLSEDDWRRLQTFSGNSKPETFLYSVSLNLIEEYSRKRYGRPRAPEWLKREGGIWVNIWKMVCLERQPVGHIIDVLCAKERRSPEYVSGIIKTIKSKMPWCGAKDRSIPVDHLDVNDDADVEAVTIASQLTLEESIEKQELEDRLYLFAELLKNINSPSKSDLSGLKTFDMGILESLRAQLDFTEEELIVVRMAFQEGLKLNLIARALNMPSYQPGRILKRVFKSMLEAMHGSDIHVDKLQTLLVEVEL